MNRSRPGRGVGKPTQRASPAKLPTRKDALEILQAIHSGAADALVVHRPEIGESIVALTDVAELASARGALADSERRFEALTGEAPVGIFQLNLRGGAEFLNRYACRLFGLSAQDALGMGWVSRLHPDDAEDMMRDREQAISALAPRTREFRLLMPDGRITWLASHSQAYRDASGKAKGFLGTISDITEGKAAALALDQAKKKMEAILNASPLAILSIDPGGLITGWSRGAERKFGWSESEAMGRICPTVPPELLEDFHDMVGRVLAGEPWRQKIRDRITKAGVRIRASINAAPLVDSEGATIGIVAMLEDVTEKERTQQRVRALLEERERVALDLHDGCIQALYAIGLKLDDCRVRAGDGDRAVATDLADAMSDLNLVIQDLRVFILGDKREIARAEDLVAALEKSVRRLSGPTPAFSLAVDPAAARALGRNDATHLLQIARAALSNAARHSNGRSGRLSLQMVRGAVRLEVSDDGEGFDQKDSDARGVGLRSIRARARKMGARLRVVSRASRGTRVVIDVARRR